MNETKKIELLFIFSFIIALGNDLWVRGKEEGIGMVIILTLFIGGLYLIARQFGLLAHKNILLLIVPIMVLVADILLYTNTFVGSFVPKIVTVAVLAIFILSTVRTDSLKQLYLRNDRLLWREDRYDAHLGSVFKALRTAKMKNGEGQSLLMRVVVGVLVALPLTAIFVLLFTQADFIFAEKFKTIFNETTPSEVVEHILFTLFLTLVVITLAYTIFRQENT
ncbi:MAG: hypothetical protein Q7K34_01840 [archaeon]|nr:hypothetical protein [archaeon]